MFNRYVDGLGTEMPADVEAFTKRGAVIAEKGYEMVVPIGVTQQEVKPVIDEAT